MSVEIDEVISRVATIILGKPHQLRLALACLLARGHLLIEDLPGVGKTTLAHALATILGLHYQRIQFTSDLLPADILGVSIYNRDSGGFQFHPGPVFSHIVLADEINRATPKTQSALLEAMEEQQVTVEGNPPAATAAFRHRHAESSTRSAPFRRNRTGPPMRIEPAIPTLRPSAFCCRADRRKLLNGIARLVGGAVASAVAGRYGPCPDALLICRHCLATAAVRRTTRTACRRAPAWPCCASCQAQHSSKGGSGFTRRPADRTAGVIGYRLQPATEQTEALSVTERMRLFLESVPVL
jgi:hypothetical protein